MKKTVIFFSVILFITTSCKNKSDETWEKHSNSNYSIEHPSSWRLDTSGKYNTEFLIYSNVGIIDDFGENVNLTIQNLSEDITLLEFSELTIKQLEAVPKSQIIKSEIHQKKEGAFYEIVWKGYVANNDLHFKQYCFIKDKKAFIVTFTAKQSTFEDYEKTATKILNSFKVI